MTTSRPVRSIASSMAAALGASIVSGFSTTASAPASSDRTINEACRSSRAQMITRSTRSVRIIFSTSSGPYTAGETPVAARTRSAWYAARTGFGSQIATSSAASA